MGLSYAFAGRRSASRRYVWLGGVVACLGLGLGLTACGGSNTSTAPTSTPVPTAASTPATTAATTGSGPVAVLYAGSLVDLMEKDIGPAFHSATGYTFNGFSGDSGTLANEIKGKTQVGDVYISANPSKDVLLEGPSNGNWVSWYAQFATSPLVIGYNPHSKFAHELQTEPWYKVVSQPGFLLGRTDPATDPKGVLAVTALNDAATTYNLPQLKQLATTTSNVYPENTLVGRLQSGQLDAGFFYSIEAAVAGIPTVPVEGSKLEAVYTITVLNHAPNETGGNAFVTFLLGSSGTALMQKDGLVLTTPPKVSGTVPADLQSVVSG
jgi:molybdate/tungstate transport system substrate-binding protein